MINETPITCLECGRRARAAAKFGWRTYYPCGQHRAFHFDYLLVAGIVLLPLLLMFLVTP